MTSTSFPTGRLLLRLALASAVVSMLMLAHIRSGVAGHNTVSNPHYEASYLDEDILRACTDFRTKHYGVVFARCNRQSGHIKSTSIDLDDHVGNIDGDLTWGETNYSETCRDRKDIEFTSSQVRFGMECQEQCEEYNCSDPGWKDTEINLREGLKNNNGSLQSK